METIENNYDEFDEYIDSQVFQEMIIKEALDMFPDLWDIEQNNKNDNRQKTDTQFLLDHIWMPSFVLYFLK